jgi:CheY-like chemotaxis protein
MSTTDECILLVEDDTDIREEMAGLLESEGYTVAQARNGQDALEQLKSIPKPCVILLDLMMPVMNGWDFRQQQLADPALKEIPTVIVSGAAQALQEARTLHATAFLQKPFEIEPLLDVIEQYC